MKADLTCYFGRPPQTVAMIPLTLILYLLSFKKIVMHTHLQKITTNFHTQCPNFSKELEWASKVQEMFDNYSLEFLPVGANTIDRDLPCNNTCHAILEIGNGFDWCCVH